MLEKLLGLPIMCFGADTKFEVLLGDAIPVLLNNTLG